MPRKGLLEVLDTLITLLLEWITAVATQCKYSSLYRTYICVTYKFMLHIKHMECLQAFNVCISVFTTDGLVVTYY